MGKLGGRTLWGVKYRQRSSGAAGARILTVVGREDQKFHTTYALGQYRYSSVEIVQRGTHAARELCMAKQKIQSAFTDFKNRSKSLKIDSKSYFGKPFSIFSSFDFLLKLF